MKKIAVIIFCFLSFNMMSQITQTDRIQYSTEKINSSLKANKKALIMSGSFLILGSIINVVKTYKNEPVFNNYSNANDFTDAVDSYKSNQKSMSRLSSLCYGASGFFMISVCFNF